MAHKNQKPKKLLFLSCNKSQTILRFIMYVVLLLLCMLYLNICTYILVWSCMSMNVFPDYIRLLSCRYYYCYLVGILAVICYRQNFKEFDRLLLYINFILMSIDIIFFYDSFLHQIKRPLKPLKPVVKVQ